MLLDTGYTTVKKTSSLHLQNLWSSRGDRHETINWSMRILWRRIREGSFPFILQGISKVLRNLSSFFLLLQTNILFSSVRFYIRDNPWNCVMAILTLNHWFLCRLNMKKILSSAMRNSSKKKLSNIVSLILGVVAELESQRW